MSDGTIMADPDRRPVDRHAALVVGAVRREAVVLADDRGAAVAEVPPPATYVVAPGDAVKAYLAADGALQGWMPVDGDLGVNLRRWQKGTAYRPAPAACFGVCGIVWEAPRADALADAGERCLECGGALEVER